MNKTIMLIKIISYFSVHPKMILELIFLMEEKKKIHTESVWYLLLLNDFNI